MSDLLVWVERIPHLSGMSISSDNSTANRGHPARAVEVAFISNEILNRRILRQDFRMLILRVLVLPLALLLGLSAHAQKDSKTPKEESCSVSGIVMKMADSAPLRKAHLSLTSVEDQIRSVGAVTNADGRFVI